MVIVSVNGSESEKSYGVKIWPYNKTTAFRTEFKSLSMRGEVLLLLNIYFVCGITSVGSVAKTKLFSTSHGSY